MVFDVKRVETATFGEILKKAREGAGLTKQKVAQFLCVQVRQLERLEAGEIEKLPAEVYTKGFLRKYAKLLSVNPESLIDEYEKEKQISSVNQKVQPRALPKLRSHWLSITPKTLRAVLIFSIIVLAVGYFIYQLAVLVSPPKLVIIEPNDNLSTSQPTINVRGSTQPGSELTINGQAVYIDKNGNFEQSFNLSPGLNTIKIEASNRFKKTSSQTRRILLNN